MVVFYLYDMWFEYSSWITPAFQGHDGSVFGCNFSNSVRLAVTYSADCTAKVWMLPSADKPVFNFTSNDDSSANEKKV